MAATISTKAISTKKTIYYFIIIALMFGIGLLPPFASLTPYGMDVLGVFLSLVFAWTVDIVMWPTLLGFIYLATISNSTFLTVFTTAIGNQTLLQTMVVLAFTYALGACGLLEYLGKWTMSLNIVKKGPYWFFGTFLVVGYIGSALTLNNSGIMIMLWAVYYQIAGTVGIKRFSKFSNCMMIGLAVGCYHGSVFFPFSLWANVVSGLYTNAAGEPLNTPFGFYILYNGITGILMIAAFILLTKYVIRPKIDFDLSAAQIHKHDLHMTGSQKFALASIFASCVFLLAPSFLPKDWALTTWLSNMNIGGCFIIIMIILSFFKNEDGKSVASLVDNVKYGINFQQFFLLASAFYLASLVTSESTGISPLLVSIIDPILNGKTATFSIIFLVFFGTILTNCINNVVSTSLMLPFILASAESLGINIIVLMTALTFMLVQGCALPSGSVIGGILHSTKDWLRGKDVYIYAIFYTIVLALIVSMTAVILN